MVAATSVVIESRARPLAVAQRNAHRVFEVQAEVLVPRSTCVSPTTATVTVLTVCSGRKVSRPLIADRNVRADRDLIGERRDVDGHLSDRWRRKRDREVEVDDSSVALSDCGVADGDAVEGVGWDLEEVAVTQAPRGWACLARRCRPSPPVR